MGYSSPIPIAEQLGLSIAGITSTMYSKTIKFNPQTEKLLTLGAGCFWGTEHIFRKHFGSKLHDCKVGYANGLESKKDMPDSVSYKKVCQGDSQFAEVLQISFDPKVVSLAELVNFFFRIHDPITLNSQGPDMGTQYRSTIYTHSEEDLEECRALKQSWQPKWHNKIITEVAMCTNFYDAEEYHQLYLDHNPQGYSCPTHYVRDL